MQADIHERAHLLIDGALLETISQDERTWLDAHAEECAECRHYAELSARTIEALDSFSIALDPAAALRVQHAVRLASARVESRNFSLGLVTAVCLTIAGSLVMWQTADWLAAQWNIPRGAWQAGFVTFWILPSVALDGLLLFRRQLMARVSGQEGQTA